VSKVLVVYASKRGSTAEIAAAVAETLREEGLNTDLAAAGEVSELAEYDAVVLGSAIYMKRWRGDARTFLYKHKQELAEKPLWVFSSGPVGDPDNRPDESWVEPQKVVRAVEELGARGHVVFGGRVPVKPRGPFERAMAQNTPPEYRDLRDWDEIRAWARGVAAQLAVTGART